MLAQVKKLIAVQIGCYALSPVSATKPLPSIVLRYRFGPYEADTTRGELRKFGIHVRLERKPWQLLITLLDHAGEVVTRSDLQHSLWGEDVFVDFDTGLNVAVKKLRGALCDSTEDSTYIETVVGEGYRFVADVEKVFFTAEAPASASPEPIAATLVPEVPAYSSIQLGDAHVPQLEQEAEPRLLAGSIGHSWLQKRNEWLWVAVVVFVVLITIAVTRLTWRRPRQPDQVHAGKIMLVVLPFENLSGDPGQEYFSDGMTEELSEQLGNLSPQRLGVIGRTSAMTYKHSPRTISQIGKDLAVDYVLEGSVRRDGNKLRVTAQLVHVSDQSHVWAEDYDRDARDLLQLEDEVAGSIARQVGVSITPDQPTRSLNHHNPDPEAHEDYLLGRYYWNRRTPVGWETAEKYFRRAIEKDPQYAPAYAGLAECRIPFEEAKAAAMKAVELDPTSGEARTALGRFELYRDLDVATAEDTFKRAIQLDPNYAIVHHSYGELLSLTGRFQEAITEKRQAAVLDPLSLVIKTALADALSLAGQHDAAEKELKVVFEMDPHYPSAHEILGNIYTRKGMYKEAIREYQKSEANGGDEMRGALGYSYALSGNRQDALRMLSHLRELDKRSGSAAFDLAVVEIGLGNKEEALAWLEKAYEEHYDDSLLLLKVDPIFDPLRSDPRYVDLLKRMGLPQ